jgi:hypothetical protein
MTGLLSSLTQIALLRKDPGSLPSSAASVAFFILLFAAADLVIIWLDINDRLLLRTVLDVAIALSFVGLLLALAGRIHRFPQTMIAILGTDLLLTPPVIALLLLRSPARSNHAIALFSTAGMVLVVVWYLLIVGHVLRSALDTGLVTGFAIAVAWWFAAHAISLTLFGAPP